MSTSIGKNRKSKILLAATALTLFAPSVATADNVIKPHFGAKLPKATVDAVVGANTSEPSAPVFNAPQPNTSLILGFEGTSDYDTRALGIGLIPPDTMGAVGLTQYVQIINGSFAAYNKATGTLAAARKTDSAFWTAAGGQATGGDPRILFDNPTQRWIAVGFNATGDGLQIATSATSDALGVWNAAQFGSFNDGRFNRIADFPTMALSGNAVVVGTNNFSAATNGGARTFQGTTLNVLNRDDIFKVGGPDVTSIKHFTTPFTANSTDRGFAIQAANRDGGGADVTVVAASLTASDNVTYKITNAGAANAAQTMSVLTGSSAFTSPSDGRQPVVGANARVVAAGDERVHSNAWEFNGRVYFSTTVKAAGSDHNVVRITVLDKATNTILSETDIGGGPSNSFDYYYGALAINSSGQVVVGYNRSGDITTGVAGRISIFARSFDSNANGTLSATSGEILIKQSLVDEYHNGSPFGQAASGRQRWGDYAAVNVDPTDQQRFWVIGQFAREYNTLQNHPTGNGSGFARWGTYIAQIGIAPVPESGTWAMMIVGFGFVGAAMRRRTKAVSVTYG